MHPKSYVYVDGFNLYYGAVKETPYRWLNIRRLCELLLPSHTIHKIKYFTARVSARRDDPDKPTRQQIY
ncbi:MAG TPA: NYN domain-containing protein, partial [Thermoleophilia bacterium]|nr:NYN domain-containing protein [Thermoleophilia bacterium]